MQNILAKKLLISLKGPNASAFLLPSTLRFSLTPLATRFFASEGKNRETHFERVQKSGGMGQGATAGDSIIAQISNSDNFVSILEIFEKNEATYKNEQVVLSLRMLGRLIRTADRLQINFNKEERFINLQKKMVKNIDLFSDHELLDLLFFIRKFKMYRIPLAFSDKEISSLYGRINEFVKAKSYSCRNLINIFYDYCHLRQPTDIITTEILNDVRIDPKILTTFSCIQILQGVSTKVAISSKDMSLLNQLIRILPNFEQDFDIEQKSTIFKYLSQLQLNYYPTRFQTPFLLYKTKDQLKEKIEYLGEMAVNNVITAYEHLPREFPVDLLDEIKEMICVTLQHDAKNIKSFFLIDIYEALSNLKIKRRRMNEEKMAIIENEILNRIKEQEEDILKYKNMENLIEILDNENRVKIINELYNNETLIKSLENKTLYFRLLSLFAKNNLDIRRYLDQELSKVDIKTHNLISLICLLSHSKDSKYEEHIKELEKKVQEQFPQDLNLFIKNLSSIGYNFHYKIQLINKLVLPTIMEMYTSGRLNFKQLVKALPVTCVSREQKIQWFELLSPKLETLENNERGFLIENLTTRESSSSEIFLLAFSLFPFPKQTPQELRRILNNLRVNKDFLSNLEKNEFLLQKLCKFIESMINIDVKAIPTHTVYYFMAKLQNIRGIKLHLFFPLMNKILLSDITYELFTQIQIGNLLLNRHALLPNSSEKLYNKIVNNRNPIEPLGRIRFFIKSLDSNSKKELDESTLQMLQSQYQTVKEKMSSPNVRVIISNLSILLSFPSIIIKQDQQFLLKTLSDYVLQGTPHHYLDLLRGLTLTNFHKERIVLNPFLKELTHNFASFGQRMAVPEILESLRLFSKAGIKNTTVFNFIIENIGKYFASLKNEELSSILRDFSSLNLKQVDLFDKILEKLTEKSRTFFNPQNILLINSLYKVGYDSNYAKSLFLKNYQDLRSNNGQFYSSLLSYVGILSLPEEIEILNNITQKLKNSISSLKNKENLRFLSTKNLRVALTFLKFVHKKNPELLSEILSALEAADSELVAKLSAPLTLGKKKLSSIKILEEYLQAMKVEYQANYSVDGFPIDIFIPSQNAMVHLVIGLEMNYDKESLKGEAILFTRIYKSIEQHKYISISMEEFMRNSDSLSKIRYLQTKGIQSPVNEADFDLTALKTIKTIQQKPKAKEVEEENAEEEELSDEPLAEKEEINPEEEENNQEQKKK